MTKLLSRKELPEWVRPRLDSDHHFSIFAKAAVPSWFAEFTEYVFHEGNGLVHCTLVVHHRSRGPYEAGPNALPAEVMIAAGAEALRRQLARGEILPADLAGVKIPA